MAHARSRADSRNPGIRTWGTSRRIRRFRRVRGRGCVYASTARAARGL